jgi:hypothetical protein
MTTRKIISDEVDTIFVPSTRKKIKNALVLTGGGTTQTFFAMGAVACLVDNGKFDFDLITAVSGGSLLLIFIDLCYNEAYNYYKEPDWYNRYVRKNVYALATAKMVPYLIKSGGNLQKFQDYIFSRIPDFNKVISSTENKTVICEYNYIDGNTQMITSDHTDIIDLEKDIKVDYWYLIRPLRCGLPFCNFNNRPAYDCGNVSNIPVSAMLTKYNMDKLVVIKSASQTLYNSYPDTTNLNLFIGWLFNNINTSGNSLSDMIDLAVQPNQDNFQCSASNELNKSQCEFHNGMINELETDLPLSVRFYNGLLYTNENAMKITENEGYIQMYHQLKKRNQASVFKIPNPEVYNENTKTIWNDWKENTNIWYELFKDVVEMKI